MSHQFPVTGCIVKSNIKQRKILSSDRLIKTLEDKTEFWILCRTSSNYLSVHGPYPLSDPRFSGVLK